MESSDRAVKMSKELYVGAQKGNVELLQAEALSDDYLRRKTYEQNNIVHIAVRHNRQDFLEACLRRFPNNDELICEKNSEKDSPLHVAAEVGNLSVVTLFHNYLEGDCTPWREQNLKGNTPVHVALIHGNVNVARFLLENDSDLAFIVNNSKEAPLHLSIKHHVDHTESESIMAMIKQPFNMGRAASVIKPLPDMINFLVEKGSFVTCWHDENGLTPLHRAASISAPYNIHVIKFILEHCPQSAEVCDSSGNSILHLILNMKPGYQEGKNLLKLQALYALRNHQDKQGNTPLHIAASNMDIPMVRVLLEASTNLRIKNIEGISATSLIRQHNLLEMLMKRKMTEEESDELERANISFLRERMSKLGTYFLLSQDSKGRNVLHRLLLIQNEIRIMPDDFVDFFAQVLDSFPSLVHQKDLDGDTPVHIFAQNHPDTKIYDAFALTSLWGSSHPSMLLELCNQCSRKVQEEAKSTGAHYEPPWLIQNAKGNTPLHEAVLANNKKLVRTLLKIDPRSASLVNKCKETPLHLLAGCSTNGEPFEREDIESMLEANIEAASWLDQDGLTPLLRAVQAANLSTASILCSRFPDTADICYANDQTFWHLLVNHPSDYYVLRLLKDNLALRNVLKSKDKNGNTPLHLAIEGNRFNLVEILLDIWESERKSEEPSKGKDHWLMGLLKIKNKAGKTLGDLIGESISLPPNIEKSIGTKNEMIGVRSLWGIPTTEMKTYVNTIGVIAALLTTITFTAAFAVPGGLIEDIGTPVLISHTAFQVFMISDVVAMCLSMMVLVCLLWIMATSKRHKSIMILDLSILLLLASFYATLLTFMTGLFAVMFPIRPWIAVVTLVLCILLMVLVLKYFVIKLLIPIGNAALIFVRGYPWCAAGLFTKIVGVGGQAHSRDRESSLAKLV